MSYQTKSISDLSNRDLSIDFLRILACFFVIMRHSVDLSIISSNSRKYWTIGVLFDSFTYISIPMFLIITGYLLLGKNEPYNLFFKKRLNKILIPFIFWSFIYILFANNFCNRLLGNNYIKLIINGNIFYHLWYVYLIIGIYLILPVINKLVSSCKSSDIKYILGLWILFSIIFPIFSRKYGYNIAISYIFSGFWGYVFLGYYLKSINISSKLFKLSLLALIATYLTVSIGTIFFTSFKRVVLFNHLDLFSPTMLLLTISIFIIIKHITPKVQYKLSYNIQVIIIKISNLTFSIYLLHALILDTFYRNILGINLNAFTFNPIFSIPLISVLTFFIALLIVLIMSYVPVIKKLV